MIAAEPGQHLQLVARVDRAGRIVRIADDDDSRTRRERIFPDVARRKMKSVAAAARDRDDVQSSHRGEGAIVRVERLEDEHVVAFIRAGNERKEDGLAAAGRRQNLARLDRNADAFRVVLPQRIEKRRRAGGRRVFENFVLNLLEPVEHARGRLDVRLPDVEVVDLRPARFRQLGQRCELSDG